MGFAKIAGAMPVTFLLLMTGCQPKPAVPAASAAETGPREAGLVDGAFLPGELPDQASASASADLSTLEISRKYEAPDIAANPDIASRKGDVLFITLDGTPVARFADRRAADCTIKQTCISWSFRGATSLASRKGKREPYALIMQDGSDGWSHFTFVGGERGLTWFSNWPEVSMDGRYVAEGSREAQGVAGYLRLVDWATPYPHATYVFDAGCLPMKWTALDTLQVNCDYPSHDGHSYATVATVTRDIKGRWRLTENAEVAFDDAEKRVAPARLKLRVIDGKQAGSAMNEPPPKAASESQLTAEGMDWLGPAGP